MTRQLIIFGGGGHAKVVLEAVWACWPDRAVTVLDDSPAAQGRLLLSLEIKAGRKWLAEPEARDAVVIPALGDNRVRSELVDWLHQAGLTMTSVLHPAATISPSAIIGAGSFVAAGVVINAQAALSEGVIVNTAASVDHDCRIGKAAHVAPGARLCGNVEVGERTLIGTGAVVIPGIKIGADAVIGAGSVVLKDVPSTARVAGCPARPI